MFNLINPEEMPYLSHFMTKFDLLQGDSPLGTVPWFRPVFCKENSFADKLFEEQPSLGALN